jgi:hypothetical protein
MSDSWKSALVTSAVALIAAGAGVATNLATEWKSNVWAWIVVALLTILAAWGTNYTSKKISQRDANSGSVAVNVATAGRLLGGNSTSSSIMSTGLVMKTERVAPDGTRVVTEYFNVDIARFAMRQDLPAQPATMPNSEGNQ